MGPVSEKPLTYPWYHLIINLSGCNENINNGSIIKKFISELIQSINMVAYGEPLIECFGTESDGGWSALQLIYTSTITFHGVNEDHSAYIDIFSCQRFDQGDVINIVNKYFAPKKIHDLLILREPPK